MKKLLLSSIALFSFAFGGIFTHFYNRTDDLSLRYNLWKVGLYSYQPEIILPALYADKNRSYLVIGKTKNQILQMLPNAHEDSLTPNQYKVFKNENEEILWIGNSNLYVSLRNGLGVYLSHEKHAG